MFKRYIELGIVPDHLVGMLQSADEKRTVYDDYCAVHTKTQQQRQQAEHQLRRMSNPKLGNPFAPSHAANAEAHAQLTEKVNRLRQQEDEAYRNMVGAWVAWAQRNAEATEAIYPYVQDEAQGIQGKIEDHQSQIHALRQFQSMSGINILEARREARAATEEFTRIFS